MAGVSRAPTAARIIRQRYVDDLVTLAARRLGGWFKPGPGWRPPPPSRVLVLKPCCAGDLIFASAALRELRRGLPASRIELAVGSWSRPVVANNPHLDGLVDLGEPGASRAARCRLLHTARSLFGRGYDWCLV